MHHVCIMCHKHFSTTTTESRFLTMLIVDDTCTSEQIDRLIICLICIICVLYSSCCQAGKKKCMIRIIYHMFHDGLDLSYGLRVCRSCAALQNSRLGSSADVLLLMLIDRKSVICLTCVLYYTILTALATPNPQGDPPPPPNSCILAWARPCTETTKVEEKKIPQKGQAQATKTNAKSKAIYDIYMPGRR